MTQTDNRGRLATVAASLCHNGPGTNDMNRLIQDGINAVDCRFGVGKGAEAHVHGAQAHGKAPPHGVHRRQDGAARSAVAKRWGGTPAVLSPSRWTQIFSARNVTRVQEVPLYNTHPHTCAYIYIYNVL